MKISQRSNAPILVSWIGDTELLVLGKIGRYEGCANLVKIIMGQDKQGSHYDALKEIRNLDRTVRDSSILLLLDKQTTRIGNVPCSFSKLILLANRPNDKEVFRKFSDAFTRLISDNYPEYKSCIDIHFVPSPISQSKGVDPWNGKDVHDQIAEILGKYPFEDQERFCFNLTPGTITQSTVLPIYGIEHAANPFFLQVSKADKTIRRFEVPFDTLVRNNTNARALEEHKDPSATNITGNSPAIIIAQQKAVRLAPSPYNIILQGESGTGKELFARKIHAASGRTGKFIARNCASLKGQIGESNMTGYAAGAFTDAKVPVKGWLAEADQGTLFLDEIEVCPLSAQETLLRILQPLRGEPITTRHYTQYGSDKDLAADVRIIVATNKDLKEMVRAGTFREDLYYRLSTFSLQIPNLEERKLGNDISLLATEFLNNFNLDCGQSKSFDKSALIALSNMTWQGNVRQLQNAVITVAFLTDHNTITAIDIKKSFKNQSEYCNNNAKFQNDGLDSLIRSGTFNYHEWLKHNQQLIAQKALSIFPQKTRAAKMLNISYTVLCNWSSHRQ